jgi:hypothetical protein
MMFLVLPLLQMLMMWWCHSKRTWLVPVVVAAHWRMVDVDYSYS